MTRPGSGEQPLRVAVIGSGPAGFYTVQQLFQAKELQVQVDMFDRLPAPYGLVRYGVAPDHPKIKSVIKVYRKLAADPRFRLFGQVEYGRDLSLDDLARHYHQVVFCTGAQTDRRLGIPGEDLAGSHPATEFVAWYNGHPDFHDYSFDLSCERAIVVGVGNVAVDVARILCRTPEELAATDIADPALEALRASRVREVVLLGRRGPAQAAFTNPEAKELSELTDTETSTLADETRLDPLSERWLEQHGDKATRRKLEILGSMVGRREPDRSRRLSLRFLVSPVEILGDEVGRVRAVKLVRNELVEGAGGALKARATDRHETLEAGLVFRSVGYHGVPLPDLPFDDRRGVIPNDAGRVQGENGPVAGLYVSGWIKRGPTGVIGTNKPDAQETVASMLEDLAADRSLAPALVAPAAVDERLADRGVRPVRYPDWERLDAAEVEAGKPQGRPRIKFCTFEAFRAALDRVPG